MIAVSPVYMIKAYKVTNDYFRVSKTQRTKGTQSQTSRQPQMFSSFLHSALNQTAKTEALGLSMLLKSAQSLQQSTQTLLSENSASLLNKRVAVSSKPNKLKAEANSGSTFQNYHLNVNAVATGQLNKGISYAKTAESPIQAGWNEFSIRQTGKTANIKFYMRTGDTNEQTLRTIKDALNGQFSGVQAAIVDDGDGKSHLQLASSQTGSMQAFTLQDHSGNAAAVLGLNQTEHSASNAKYRVNGGAEQSSESNDIELDKGHVKLTFLQPDNDEITVTIGADSDATSEPIKQFVSKYNRFQQDLLAAPDFINRSFLGSLDLAAKPNTLKQLGLSEQADGTLAFNEAMFKKQVTEHFPEVKSSLGGVGSLTYSLSRSLNRLEQMPSQALFSLDGSSLKPFSQYQSRMQAFLPLPMNGLLLDRVM